MSKSYTTQKIFLPDSIKRIKFENGILASMAMSNSLAFTYGNMLSEDDFNYESNKVLFTSLKERTSNIEYLDVLNIENENFKEYVSAMLEAGKINKKHADAIAKSNESIELFIHRNCLVFIDLVMNLKSIAKKGTLTSDEIKLYFQSFSEGLVKYLDRYFTRCAFKEGSSCFLAELSSMTNIGSVISQCFCAPIK